MCKASEQKYVYCVLVTKRRKEKMSKGERKSSWGHSLRWGIWGGGSGARTKMGPWKATMKIFTFSLCEKETQERKIFEQWHLHLNRATFATGLKVNSSKNVKLGAGQGEHQSQSKKTTSEALQWSKQEMMVARRYSERGTNNPCWTVGCGC